MDDVNATLNLLNISDNHTCHYQGTDNLHIKIYLIGGFGTGIAICSIVFNSFLALVFAQNPQLRKTSLFYFNILAILDIIMGFNYIALMSVPVKFFSLSINIFLLIYYV